MSQSGSSSSIPSSNQARRQGMEACVDELAELARTEISASQFLGEVLNRLLQYTAARIVRFWQPLADGSWKPAVSFPVEGAGFQDQSADHQPWLADVARTRQLSTRTFNQGFNGDARYAARTICPIVHAGQAAGLFDVTHDLEPNRELPPDVVPFLKVVSEITADFLSQTELRQLRQARSSWVQSDQFMLALMQTSSLRQLAATIVNDGRLFAECDRVTLLSRSGSKFKTLAVTGVEQIEPRSNTVRSMESLADNVAAGNLSVWYAAGSSGSSLTPAINQLLAEHAESTGARAVGVIPIPQQSSASAANAIGSSAECPQVVLAVEQFQDVADLPFWKSRAEVLAQRCQPLLLASLDRESIPFYQTLQSWRHATDWINRSRLMMLLSLAALLTGLLTLVTTEFTVTGVAELVPDHRREIFASSSGIVDQLLVKHGDDVEIDQPLVVLRDPQLDLELPKVIGEIDVVRERLKGVLAARLAGGATADAANRARQLTSEEEELKERQQSLNRQRALIEQQQAALILKSPIRGQVLTWDVSTLLSARPVERGQSLLTIGDTGGPWVIEMRVADKDFGHVRRAQNKLKPNLDVDFLLASDPSRTYRGTIRDVAQATSLDDQLGISVKITVTMEQNEISNPLAGTTAIPRIRCGRQSIGYVWLHDLIDAVRTRLLF